MSLRAIRIGGPFLGHCALNYKGTSHAWLFVRLTLLVKARYNASKRYLYVFLAVSAVLLDRPFVHKTRLDFSGELETIVEDLMGERLKCIMSMN